MGYLLACPLRKLSENPRRVLEPYIKPGMRVLDVGSGMGFFTLDMARLVGDGGAAIAVDLQQKMISSLERRAKRAGLADRISTRLCSSDSLGIDDLAGQVDFVLAYAVVHEVPDTDHLMGELYAALKPGGQLLLAEPSGHVDEAAYKITEGRAEAAGFRALDHPDLKRSRSTLFAKPTTEQP